METSNPRITALCYLLFISLSILTGALRSLRLKTGIEQTSIIRTQIISLLSTRLLLCHSKHFLQWKSTPKSQLLHCLMKRCHRLLLTGCRLLATESTISNRFWIIEKINLKTTKPWQLGKSTGLWDTLSQTHSLSKTEKWSHKPCHQKFWLRTICLIRHLTNFRLRDKCLTTPRCHQMRDRSSTKEAKKWMLWFRKIKLSSFTLTGHRESL